MTKREAIPRDSASGGDMRVEISVSAGGFSGTYENVWFEKREYDEFVTRLHQLEKTRSGEAVLTSVSPDEFKLRFMLADSLGHIVAEGELKRRHYEGTSLRTNCVSFELDIDPTTLMDIAKQFSELFDA
jgi:hypothetical protein